VCVCVLLFHWVGTSHSGRDDEKHSQPVLESKMNILHYHYALLGGPNASVGRRTLAIQSVASNTTATPQPLLCLYHDVFSVA